MLRLSRLELDNFGPLKGRQTLVFPEDDGVTIIYGDNMRGKTILLNAIRYVLFGTVLGRGSRELPLRDLENWEARKEKEYGFEVALEFTFAGSNYFLTRQFRPRDGVATPSSDKHYDHEVFLKRDGVVLGPAERDKQLSQILPEQISRFFLFDGELLQEYEELLREESDVGRRIKEAIERVLGLPLLTNARDDLEHLRKDAQKRVSKAARKYDKTQELGQRLTVLTEQRTEHDREIAALRDGRQAAKARKLELEKQLKNHERSATLIEERSGCEAIVESAKGRMATRRERLRQYYKAAWRDILFPRVREETVALRSRVDELRDCVLKAGVTANLREKLQRSLAQGECTLCGTDLAGETRRALEQQIRALEDERDVHPEEKEELRELEKRLRVLSSFDQAGRLEAIRELEVDVNEAAVECENARQRIREIDELLQQINVEEIKALQEEYANVTADITSFKQSMAAEEATVEELEEQIDELERKLNRTDVPDLSRAKTRREMLAALRDLFSLAVDDYRDGLKEEVATDASAIFLQLTTEPEYASLAINDSYGLTIVHEDGSDVPIRSAGAEHVVALALIGALQRNAPFKGPLLSGQQVKPHGDQLMAVSNVSAATWATASAAGTGARPPACGRCRSHLADPPPDRYSSIRSTEIPRTLKERQRGSSPRHTDDGETHSPVCSRTRRISDSGKVVPAASGSSNSTRFHAGSSVNSAAGSPSTSTWMSRGSWMLMASNARRGAPPARQDAAPATGPSGSRRRAGCGLGARAP